MGSVGRRNHHRAPAAVESRQGRISRLWADAWGNQPSSPAFNNGEYEEIYSETTDEFRRAASRADEIKVFETVHSKMGNPGKMSIKGFHISASTRGTFVNEVYDTQFSLGQGQEGFIWRIDQDTARLVTYHVDSPNFR